MKISFSHSRLFLNIPNLEFSKFGNLFYRQFDSLNSLRSTSQDSGLLEMRNLGGGELLKKFACAGSLPVVSASLQPYGLYSMLGSFVTGIFYRT